MKYCVFVFICSLAFVSCATLANRSTYKMPVSANEKGASLQCGKDTFTLPGNIILTRADTPVQIAVLYNGNKQELVLYPSLNPQFVKSNTYYFPGLGHLVDLSNNARFYYGKKLFINLSDTTGHIETGYTALYKRPMKKGNWNVIFSTPNINNFYMQPLDNGVRTGTGLLGIAAGGEYVYRENRFLQVATGIALDFLVPTPASIRRVGNPESMNTLFVSLTNNSNKGAFTFGYGVHYSRHNWGYFYYKWLNEPLGKHTETIIRNHSLGFVVNAYWKVGRNRNIGIVYRPSFYSIKPQHGVLYQHSLSVDMQWRLPIQNTVPRNCHYSVL